MSWFRSLAVAALCGICAGLPAQERPQLPTDPAAQIRVQVNEVIVPVTVRDEKGKFVSNLVKSDFRILDEGRPQNIQFFSHSSKQPVVVGFLVDQSNAMKIHWDKYKEAIKELVWALLPAEDKRFSGYLITYSNDAELAVNTTTDSDKITSKVDKMKPAGGAALFDAVYMSCTRRDLVKGEPYEPRRVVVIVGDGHDSASKHSMEEVLELAQRNLVTIYAVSTKAYGFDAAEGSNLEKLAIDTGGHVEYPLNNLYKDVSGYLSQPSDEGNYALKVGTGGYAAEVSKGIINAVGGITHEVTTQYILRYTPDVDPEAKPRLMRRIKVEIPELPNVKISARTYYYPNPVGSGQ